MKYTGLRETRCYGINPKPSRNWPDVYEPFIPIDEITGKKWGYERWWNSEEGLLAVAKKILESQESWGNAIERIRKIS